MGAGQALITGRIHHLHLIPTGSARLDDELVFRDYLRAHPDQAVEPAAVQRQSAAAHAADREAYTLAEAGSVEAVTAPARIWRDSGSG